ncbi:Leucine-rich repeat receptor-like tyrosine-protein kinase PXC3 [Zea mays]|uniref:Leucine-rich repeat receptor-like tyrosine-protein kinase PXC3 n=1 Tax=Zea mays TaxID=4577 RepID=A0A3L6G582_MAIZE|nr:Leucine-rich repeat receptor-like tyrosine-protein kinase PXC3 [Zea mays]
MVVSEQTNKHGSHGRAHPALKILERGRNISSSSSFPSYSSRWRSAGIEEEEGKRRGRKSSGNPRTVRMTVVERRYGPCTSHGSFLLRLLLLPFFFFLCFIDVPPAGAAATTQSPPLDNTQKAIMNDVASLVNSGSANTRWNTAESNPCNWEGITCTSNTSSSAVTRIALSNYGLANSSIFGPLCRLGTLRYLDLSRNFLADLSAPFFASSSSSCSMKEGLQSLNLSTNRLASPLGELAGFPQLQVLDLSFNSFASRNLSAELGYFPKLRSFNTSSNDLNGDVPTSMVGSLEELVLSSNNLSGPIPLRLFEYENLTLLDLSQNNLTGAIPDNFTSLSKLETLLLSGNKLIGEIPSSLSNVTTLSRFAANQNGLTGPIHSWITKHIGMLDLSYNKLNGTIPSDFLSHQGLQSVDLTSNLLNGAIPATLSHSLYRLRLGGNQLGENIPGSVCDTMGLTYLELDDNQLTGVIPSELSKCKNLTLLNLASNRLHGLVPSITGELDKLVVLKLQNNTLTGQVPSTFSELKSLITLNLSKNSLSGAIPSGIFELPKLSNLYLQGNQFSGFIPFSISSSKDLIELNLGDNALTGNIPTMPTTVTTSLLNLSHNLLDGSIPSNINSLGELEILDLSHNALSGAVPSSLWSLQSLTLLDLSYNNLSGSIPRFGPSQTVDIVGNPGLVIVNGTGNNNDTPTTGKKKRHYLVVIIFTIAGTLVGLCVLVLIIVMSLSKRVYRVEDEGLPAGESVPQIISGRLITMNSIHTSAVDFVKAIEAVSNHQNIFLKTRFCTYYKAVMPNGSTYSVKKLNSSDKIFQIGSQEKFSHEIEVLGKLTNSNVMVPLAYILTADCAYLIYEHAYNGTVSDLLHGGKSEVIDWPSRYSVALGVAQGLTFLHGCTQPVLLLDLSTRTIHLKSKNEPQIGDIELYKIIDPSRSTGSFSTIAGTVGYIPPEYAYTMRLTMAGNVYSFGVILLELLTGKKSVSNGTELAKWALSLSGRPDEREQILDTRVSGTSIAVHSQMLSVLNIALSCVAFSPDARPKMRNVLRMLFNAK